MLCGIRAKYQPELNRLSPLLQTPCFAFGSVYFRNGGTKCGLLHDVIS
jgi:hypothetical protein